MIEYTMNTSARIIITNYYVEYNFWVMQPRSERTIDKYVLGEVVLELPNQGISSMMQ